MERSTSSSRYDPNPNNEGDDRRSRFQNNTSGNEKKNGSSSSNSSSLRDRASSQPPGTSDSTSSSSFVSSPPSQYYFPSNVGGGGPWNTTTNTRMLSSSNRGSGGPSVPTRSSSLSNNPQGQFSSVMRERAFPSTFEDDESEALSDTYDDIHIPPSSSSFSRGRTYAQDPSRSRSQSMATTSRTVGGSSPFTSSSSSSAAALQSWNHNNNTNPLNIPVGRYGELKPPPPPPGGSSRYGSLGTLAARSPTNNIHNNTSSSPSGGGPSFVTNGFSGSSNNSSNRHTDISNMSPFVRDVGQILVDDGAAFRELWAGMHPPRDENGGGGSGTTSRRHSVSVVQPRSRGGNVVGFHAPGGGGGIDTLEEPSRSSAFQTAAAYSRSGLLLTDDDLSSGLGLLNINPNEPPPLPSSSSLLSQQHPPSQPSSLPIYAPLSRSPPSRDLMSKYQSINLSIPGGSTGMTPYSRQMGTPSETDFSTGGNDSPGLYEQQQQLLSETHTHFNSGTARYIPGQGIQYLPPHQQQGGGGMQQQQHLHHHPGPPSPQYGRARAPSYSSTSSITSPISPTTGRVINPQQPPYYPQTTTTQRRLSDAQYHPPLSSSSSSSSQQQQQQQSLSELGKGVPLHSVPSSWPLFIVEFKAGRTDLFYLTDLSQDIRNGDLVMVEADRGKDLGKVVNDSITLAEVEAFQRQQMERGYAGGGGGSGSGSGSMSGEPTSPGGGGGGNGKKEINPKMIYGKATPQELQYVFPFSFMSSCGLIFFFSFSL